MNTRLSAAIEAHPLLAWMASVVSFFTGATAWMVDHADDAAKVFGVFAAVFAAIAGYYTMRIQRRAWQRGDTTPPVPRELRRRRFFKR